MISFCFEFFFWDNVRPVIVKRTQQPVALSRVNLYYISLKFLLGEMGVMSTAPTHTFKCKVTKLTPSGAGDTNGRRARFLFGYNMNSSVVWYDCVSNCGVTRINNLCDEKFLTVLFVLQYGLISC